MFTNQMQELDRLGNIEGFPNEAVEVLRAILGNCQAILEHRGPVAINGTRPPGAVDAMLTVTENTGHADDGYEKNPDGPFALCVEGLAKFDPPLQFDQIALGRPRMVGGVPVPQIFFPPQIGIAKGNWIDDQGLGQYVQVYIADNLNGDNLDTSQVYTVFIPNPNPTRFSPNIVTGQPITFTRMPDGTYMAQGVTLDDVVGFVKIWEGLEANIPSGWEKVTTGALRYLAVATDDSDNFTTEDCTPLDSFEAFEATGIDWKAYPLSILCPRVDGLFVMLIRRIDNSGTP